MIKQLTLIIYLFISIPFIVHCQTEESPENAPDQMDSEQSYLADIPEEPDFSEFEDDLMAEDNWETWLKPTGNLEKSYKEVRPDHPLNPKSALFDFEQNEEKAILDLELSSALTEQITFRLRDKIRYQHTDYDESFDRYSMEAYLQWSNVQKSVVVDLGKVKVDWGSGYAWNPTQLLIPLHKETEDSIYEDEGIEMVKLEISKDLMTAKFLLARLEHEEVKEKNRYQSAVHLTLDFEPWSVSAVYHQATEKGNSTGLSFSGLLTDALEFHGEWSQSSQRNREVPVQLAPGMHTPPFDLPAKYDYQEDQSDKTWNRYLIGGQYTFLETMNIIFEVYHNEHGYNNAEWDDIKNGIQEANRENAWEKEDYPYSSERGNPYAGFLKNTMQEIKDEQVRQNYLFLRYSTGKLEHEWEWGQILFHNIDDNSQMHQSVLSKTWMNQLVTKCSVSFLRGDDDSEFGMTPYLRIYTVEVSMKF